MSSELSERAKKFKELAKNKIFHDVDVMDPRHEETLKGYKQLLGEWKQYRKPNEEIKEIIEKFDKMGGYKLYYFMQVFFEYGHSKELQTEKTYEKLMILFDNAKEKPEDAFDPLFNVYKDLRGKKIFPPKHSHASGKTCQVCDCYGAHRKRLETFYKEEVYRKGVDTINKITKELI